MKNITVLALVFFLQFTCYTNALYLLPDEFNHEVHRYTDAPECSGEKSTWRNCRAIINLEDEIVYSGHFLDGKQHGYGVQTNYKKNILVDGLWYKGDLVFAVVQNDKEKIYTGFSNDSEMIGFTEIIEFKGRDGLNHSNVYNYAHLQGNESAGNIVKEMYDNGDLASTYLGPGDGIRPSEIGFLYIAGDGFKWCSIGSNRLPCSKQKIIDTAISSLKDSFNNLSVPDRIKIQTSLQRFFYYNSEIDGKWGQNTQYALLKYLALHTNFPLFPEASFSLSLVKKIFLENELYDLRYGDMVRLLETGYRKKIKSFGTGFLFSKSGDILTNKHVVSQCNEIMFSINDKVVEVALKSAETLADLAILASDLKPTTLLSINTNKSEPELMDKVFAVGFPFGGELAKNITITSGIISSEPMGDPRSKIFQFDAAIQPGNSGGPVIDENRNLVGIATAKADAEYFLQKFGSIPEGISFAIDLESIKLFLAENDYTEANLDVSESIPDLKNIVGMITCQNNTKTDLHEIQKARLP